MDISKVNNVQTTHSRVVLAPATTVYKLLADVSRWPVIFPPTIHAEQFDLGGQEQRIQLWATANETVKTWTSLRRLDPQNLCIEFAQELPAEPLSAISGRWLVKSKSETSCLVELTHEFSSLDDNPSVLSWIKRAVETNSTKEIASLGKAATRAAADAGLVFEFSDSIEVAGPARRAYEFIEQADAWQARLPHVASVNLTLVAPDIQLLEMDTVANDGSKHRTASFRVCFPHRAIVYKQTTTAPVQDAHVGRWAFAEADGISVVTSSHAVVLNSAELGRLPESARSIGAARDFVTQALSANSQATLRLMKDFVEKNTGG
jgi:aromatase